MVLPLARRLAYVDLNFNRVHANCYYATLIQKAGGMLLLSSDCVGGRITIQKMRMGVRPGGGRTGWRESEAYQAPSASEGNPRRVFASNQFGNLTLRTIPPFYGSYQIRSPNLDAEGVSIH